MTTSAVLADLEARGLVHLTTDRDALDTRLAEGPITAYYGCDPTADSLHIGNLIGLLILRRLQDAGHRVIALAGGATGMIGDPSGRSDERNLLDEATLRSNVVRIKEQITRVVGHATLVDNWEWTEHLTLTDFLRDVGKHVTVNQMVARDSVRARLESEQGISYTEFTYMLLQAQDYLHLHDAHGCELQIGGSDQWGNIVSGADLVRRSRAAHVHALCWPLLTAPDGTKLGKSTGARTWLAADRTSPYQLFQHLVNVDDDDLERHLLWFTLLPVDEVATVLDQNAADPGRRVAHRRLAHEVTSLVHGPAAAEAARGATAVLFGGDPTEATPDALAAVAREVPSHDLGPDLPTVGSLVHDLGMASSTSDVRRAFTQGAIYVNGERLAEDRDLTSDDLLHGTYALVRKGKRTYGVGVAGPG